MVRLQQQEKTQIFEITEEEVKEFEQELESYKVSAIMDKSLDYYGWPLKKQDLFPGYIVNSILNGVHWSVIKYCLENQIIGRRDWNESWFIVAEVLQTHINGNNDVRIEAWSNFKQKWEGLKKLKYKRNSEKKYKDFTFNLEKQEEKSLELIEKMSFEENDIKPEDLPF